MEAMETKYRLLPKKVSARGHRRLNVMHKFHQIQAVRDIPRHNVKAGDLGGLVSSPLTLSQEGDCWIGKSSVVQSSSLLESKGISSVQDNALVAGGCHAKNSIITGDAVINAGSSYLKDSKVGDNASILGSVVCIIDSYIIGSSMVKTAPHKKHPSRLDIKNSYFSQALIEAEGYLSNVSTDELFEAEGIVKIKFVREDKIIRNLSKPFKASGSVSLDCLKLSNTTVDISGVSVLKYGYLTGGSLKVSDGVLYSVIGSGVIEVTGDASIYGAQLEGVNIIQDGASISKDSKLTGHNIISGNMTLPTWSKINNQKISIDKNGIIRKKASEFHQIDHLQGKIDTFEENSAKIQKEIENLSGPAIAMTVPTDYNNDLDIYRETIKSVEADYEAYTTDIVKLIKYPAMGDASIPETQELMVSLRTAQRAMLSNNEENLEQSSKDVERTFVRAENNAIILANSFLDEKRKQNLKRAGQALSIALDENAGEHERRAGYKSGMKNLEGVLLVTEQAVSVLKERIGLKEIES